MVLTTYRKLVDDVARSGQSDGHADGDHPAVVVVVRVRRVRQDAQLLVQVDPLNGGQRDGVYLILRHVVSLRHPGNELF